MQNSLHSISRDWRRKVWFLVNMYFTMVYLLWRIFFTIPFGYGFVSVFAGVFLLVVEVLGMVEAFIHYFNMYNVECYPLPQVPEGDFPEVDVFVSTYSESVELLYKTLLACRNMEYPDKRKVHIFLCDDGHREKMRALAQELEVGYLDRPDHKEAKAGNLNHALSQTGSPYVVTFDADMMPRSCFLLKTIPYFVDAEEKNRGRSPEKRIELGFVQTPQSFVDLDLFQFCLYSENRIPNEQDYFYRDIQVARTRTNSVIYGGSNTVLSRKALEEVGGFYTGAITEDFATGVLIEKKGYVSLGLEEPLASGMNPGSLRGLIRQRSRWARGVIATGRKMRILTCKDLTFAQKMNYWASVWYWYAPLKRLSYIFSPILYAALGYMVVKCTLPEVLLFWLPMYISSNISLKSLSQNIRNTKWTAIYETALFPFLLLPVLLETFGISMRRFQVTEKRRGGSDESRLLYAVPFVAMIFLSAIGIGNCLRTMFASGSFGPVVVLFWLLNNLFMLIMALFFVDGRRVRRREERVTAAIPARLEIEDVSYDCVTQDLSESGAAIFMDAPHFPRPGAKIFLEVEETKVPVELVYVTDEREGLWRYALQIPDLGENRERWLRILYDRIPTLPDRIRKNSGFYEDLSLNIFRRAVEPRSEKRRSPRLLLDSRFPTDQGEVELYDFGYLAVTVHEKARPEKIQIHFPGLTPMDYVYSREAQGRGLYLLEDPAGVYETQEDCDRVMRAVLPFARREKPRTEKKGKKAVFDEMDAVVPQ